MLSCSGLLAVLAILAITMTSPSVSTSTFIFLREGEKIIHYTPPVSHETTTPESEEENGEVEEEDEAPQNQITYCNEEGLFEAYKNLKNVTPVDVQLFEYRECHKVPSQLTTSAGQPVDISQTFTLNSDLITNPFFMDTLKHSVQEKIPERVNHGKGAGALGYFEVTNDITKYCKAKLFEKVGKTTPLVARFSNAAEESGGNDLARGLRGLAIKFYTEEGNLDLLTLQVPVFFIREPIWFGSLNRVLHRNPKTHLKDTQAVVDFVTLHPNALNVILQIASQVGIPKTYRQMNAWPIHTFELNNAHGERYFARFVFLSNQGTAGFTNEEAVLMGDIDYHTRDLYNAIEKKKYPSWNMVMDVMTLEQIEKADFDPFDVTRTWPEGSYETVPIGQIVLNKNADNFFAQVEQAAFNPANLVPGIPGPLDQLWKGRIIAYTDTQIYRLGINRNRIDVNCPLHQQTYNRNGRPPVLENMGGAPVHYPNSFHGPVASEDENMPKPLRITERESSNFAECAEYFNELSDSEKEFVVDNLAGTLIRSVPPLKQRFIKLLSEIDEKMGERVSQRAEEILDSGKPVRNFVV